MKKCRDLTLVASMVPQVERMELGIVMSPEAKHVKFPHLTHLTVNKDMFAIDFNLIHDLLANCVSILVFKVRRRALCSLLLASYFLLPAPCSLLPAPCSLLPAPSLICQVYSLKLSHYSEDRFCQLFLSQPHLARLQQLGLNFRSCSPVTARLVHCLAQTCPNLQVLRQAGSHRHHWSGIVQCLG